MRPDRHYSWRTHPRVGHACWVASSNGTALSGRHLCSICEGRAGTRMNWNVLRLLYVHELKMLLRARRTVIMAIVIPAVMMPLMLYAQKYSHDRRERTLHSATYRYVITGPLAERIRQAIQDARDAIDPNDEDLAELRQFKFEELRTVSDPRENLDANVIQFYIDTYSGEEADKLSQKTTPAPRNPSAPPAARRLAGVPLINVVYREDRDVSDTAHSQMMWLLRIARQRDAQSLIVTHGFPGDPKQLFAVDESNIA